MVDKNKETMCGYDFKEMIDEKFGVYSTLIFYCDSIVIIWILL